MDANISQTLGDKDIMLKYFFDITDEKKIPQAIIIEGSTADRREQFSKIISKWAVCKSDIKPCGCCAGCKKAESNSHPDVFVLSSGRKSKAIYIDDIRKIREAVSIRPNEAQNKVYIIEDAEHMTPQAQNALLKIFEEPPDNVLFILTCEYSSSMLKTICSRAQIYRLSSAEPLETDPKVLEKAEAISIAIIDKKEFDVSVILGEVAKNRESLAGILDALILIFRDGYAASFGINQLLQGNIISKKISETFDKEQIIYIIETSDKYKAFLAQNPNTNLFVTCLSIELKKSIAL